MLPFKRKLLSTTFLPLMVGVGVALVAGSSSDPSAQSENPCAAKKPVAGKAACNPCAVSAAAPCNPCAAKGAASDRTYTIREGDSLAEVAALTYGDASLYRMLADYNGIADPDLIVVGQEIRIPANPCAAQKVAAAANPCNPCNPCAAEPLRGSQPLQSVQSLRRPGHGWCQRLRGAAAPDRCRPEPLRRQSLQSRRRSSEPLQPVRGESLRGSEPVQSVRGKSLCGSQPV